MKSSLHMSSWSTSSTALKSQADEKIALRGDEILRINHRGQPLTLEGLKGVVYVTVPNDLEDYMLRPGERLVIRQRGAVVVQGMPEGAFRVM